LKKLNFMILLSILILYQCATTPLKFQMDPSFDPKLIKKVAVFEFEPTPGEPSSGKILQEAGIEAFKKQGFNVLEKEKVKEAFSKLGLRTAKEYSESEMKKLISELGVDTIVYGKVMEFTSSGSPEGLLHDSTPQPMPGATIPYTEYSYSLYITLNLFHESLGKTVFSAEYKKQGKGRTINMKEISTKAVIEITSKLKTQK